MGKVLHVEYDLAAYFELVNICGGLQMDEQVLLG